MQCLNFTLKITNNKKSNMCKCNPWANVMYKIKTDNLIENGAIYLVLIYKGGWFKVCMPVHEIKTSSMHTHMNKPYTVRSRVLSSSLSTCICTDTREETKKSQQLCTLSCKVIIPNNHVLLINICNWSKACCVSSLQVYKGFQNITCVLLLVPKGFLNDPSSIWILVKILLNLAIHLESGCTLPTYNTFSILLKMN